MAVIVVESWRDRLHILGFALTCIKAAVMPGRRRVQLERNDDAEFRAAIRQAAEEVFASQQASATDTEKK